MRSLLRTQLRHAASALIVLVLVTGAFPLLFALVPRLATVRVLAVPLPWLLLGVTVYPALLVVAHRQVRAAERAERDFTDIVSHRP